MWDKMRFKDKIMYFIMWRYKFYIILYLWFIVSFQLLITGLVSWGQHSVIKNNCFIKVMEVTSLYQLYRVTSPTILLFDAKISSVNFLFRILFNSNLELVNFLAVIIFAQERLKNLLFLYSSFRILSLYFFLEVQELSFSSLSVFSKFHLKLEIG